MVIEDPQWPRASAWLDGSLGPAAGGAPTLGVLGAPLSRTSISPSGADATPEAVRAALRRFSPFFADAGVDLAEAVAVRDLGDVPIADADVAEAMAALAAAVRDVAPRPDVLVVLGGDNAVTRPALAGYAGDLGRVGLLTLDAHHDVRGFHAGPTNGTPVRGLIEDGLPGRNVVQVGIGSFTNSGVHRGWAAAQGVTVVQVAEARAEGVGACVARLLVEHVHVAAYAPGCPGARPGGMAPWELHDAARAAGAHPAVVGIDIVEVDATADVAGVTVDNAALCLLHAAAGLARR
jgi:formiminoglutamase